MELQAPPPAKAGEVVKGGGGWKEASDPPARTWDVADEKKLQTLHPLLGGGLD